jgi:alkylation response protein AidB-like acyl-CoA dehydrogenase
MGFKIAMQTLDGGRIGIAAQVHTTTSPALGATRAHGRRTRTPDGRLDRSVFAAQALGIAQAAYEVAESAPL